MSNRSILRFVALAATVLALTAGLAPPVAAAGPIRTKTQDAPGGRSGTVAWYADRDGSRVRNSVNMSATDSDGSGGRCTETWVDYRTRPRVHYNPGLFVNCSGGTRRVTGAVDNDYKGVVGVAVVVCEVPDTSGRISRTERNCRGRLNEVWVRPGQRYDQFRVNAVQHPGGVRIWRA